MAQEDSPLLFGTVLEPPRRLSSLNRICSAVILLGCAAGVIATVARGVGSPTETATREALARDALASPAETTRDARAARLLGDAALMARLRDDSAPADVSQTLTIEPGVCSPDGYARMGACVTINGSVQGPTIVARVGEVVEVVIVNALDQAGATVHFHGNHYLGTPYFDRLRHDRAGARARRAAR